MDFAKKSDGYKEILVEEEKQFLTVTESDGSWEGNEKTKWREGTQRKPRSRVSKFIAEFRRLRWLIDVALLIINISLSLVLLRAFQTENSSSSIQVGGDFSGTGLDFPTKVVKFAANEAYVPKNVSEFFLDDVVATWNTMLPAGAGWGSVTEFPFFTTSMTHQLHCVFMMTRIYASLTSGTIDKLPSDYHSHYLHCVDYLRQGIMCSADLTMEPHDITDADDNGPLDGSWNGYHVCKDYSHVMPYLEEQIVDGVRNVLPIDD